MKQKWIMFKQKFSKWWKQVDGKKTYVTAIVLLILTVVKAIFADAIPQEAYDTIKRVLELLLYGSATHGIYKTIKNK